MMTNRERMGRSLCPEDTGPVDVDAFNDYRSKVIAMRRAMCGGQFEHDFTLPAVRPTAVIDGKSVWDFSKP